MALSKDHAVAVIVILAAACIVIFGRRTLAVGDSVGVGFTLVPQDAVALACSSDGSLSDAKCEYDGAGNPIDTKEPLRPVVLTSSRDVVLLSGIWASAGVQDWLQEARRRERDERVEVSCLVKYIGTMHDVAVRFREHDAFGARVRLRVATVSECRVTKKE